MARLWQYQRLAAPVTPPGQEAETIFASSWDRPQSQPDRRSLLRRAAAIAAMPFLFLVEAPAAAPQVPDLPITQISQPYPAQRAVRQAPHSFFVEIQRDEPVVFGLQPIFAKLSNRYLYPCFFAPPGLPAELPTAPDIPTGQISQPLAQRPRTAHLAPSLFAPVDIPPAPPTAPDIPTGQISQPLAQRPKTAHLAPSLFAPVDIPPAPPTSPDIPTGQISQPLAQRPKTAHRAPSFFAPVDAPPPPPSAPDIQHREIERPPLRLSRAPHLSPSFFFEQGDQPAAPAPDVTTGQISQPLAQRPKTAHLAPFLFAPVELPAPPPPAPDISYPETGRPPLRLSRAPHLSPSFFMQGEPIAAPVGSTYFWEKDIPEMLERMGLPVTVGGVTVKAIVTEVDEELAMGEGTPAQGRAIVVRIKTGPPVVQGTTVVVQGKTCRAWKVERYRYGAMTRIYCQVV